MSLRPRVIPALTLENGYLVKTVRFAKPRYVGDPINAVKIFNEKQVDELLICDISASRRGKSLDFALLEDICSEAFMPIAYGGGISNAEDAARLFDLGIEKVVLNSALRLNPGLVREIAATAGSQSVVAAADFKRPQFRAPTVTYSSGRVASKENPAEWARRMQALGAGEILINSIDRDGTRRGYDTEQLAAVSTALEVPVIALGGADQLCDMRAALKAGAAAAAAGSMFVFSGKHQAVLITYPEPNAVDTLLQD